MSNPAFERIDREEEQRIKDLEKKLASEGQVKSSEIFQDTTIPRILNEGPLSFVGGFQENDAAVLANSALFSKVLVTLCPQCSCNLDPQQLRPYLERGMVLPLLLTPLAKYKPKLADLVLQYPYIGWQPYEFVRVYGTFNLEGSPPAMCTHCFDKKCNEIVKKVCSGMAPSQAKRTKEAFNDCLFSSLSPTMELESHILQEIQDAVNRKNSKMLDLLKSKCDTIYTLRSSQVFDAVPNVDLASIANIEAISQKMGAKSNVGIIQEMQKKEWTLQELELDYSPTMPVEEYLDIVLPRKKKIASLVDAVISKKGGKHKELSDIKDELWRINQEMSESKKLETVAFLTNFVHDNAGILLQMLVGGYLGYSLGSSVGCGLGGLAGGAVGKIIAKRKMFKTPELPKKTLEWVKEKIEDPQEKFLSIALSKDIRVIQTWNLRRKLKK